jgi:hypothetical protein
MKSDRVSAWVLLLTLAGCASFRGGDYGVPVGAHSASTPQPLDKALLVSGGELSSLSSARFGALEITFENPGGEWIHVRRVGLDLGRPALNAAVTIPGGADLEAWLEATELRNAEGLVASVAHEERSGAAPAVGAPPANGMLTVAVARGLSELAEAGDADQYPNDHLMSVPFTVPPGLTIKRWIVLGTPPGLACVSRVVLEYETEGGPRRVALTVNHAASLWQRRECPVEPVAWP